MSGFEADFWSWESVRGLRQAAGAVAGVHTTNLLNVFIGIMTLLTLFVTVGVAAWGFWAALAGHPLFRVEILATKAEAR